jgi:outer membrane immunogenic protein
MCPTGEQHGCNGQKELIFMRRIFAISLATLAAGVAMPTVAQEDSGWTGFYVGGTVGYDILDDDSNDTVTFDRGNNGTFGETVTTSTGADAFSPGFCGGSPTSTAPGTGCNDDGDEFSFSGRIGYDVALGSNMLIGLVGEVGMSNLSDNVTAFSTTPASYTFTRNVDYTAAARARVGWTQDRGMVYVTGGYLRAKMDNDFNTSNTANTFTQNNAKQWAQGFQLGGGGEYKITDAISLGLEYLYNDVSNGDYSVTVGQGTAGATNPFVLAGGVTMTPQEKNLSWHALRAVVNFRF